MERNQILVIDTSVVIKWYSDEENSDKALALQTALSAGAIIGVAPELQLYEFSNVMRYKKNREYTRAAVDAFIKSGIQFHITNQEILSASVELAYKHEISVYDASFLALAIHMNATLITADKKMYDKIQDNINVILLAEL